MHEELENESDLKLLGIYMSDPASLEGKAAEALLRYRQYLATKAYNRWLIILTIVLALSAASQSLAAWTPTLIALRQPGTSRQAGEVRARPADDERSARADELLHRVEKLERRLDDRRDAPLEAAPAESTPK
jgi:hypothetical protein